MLRGQILLRLSMVVVKTLIFILDESQRLLEVYDLELSLILHILILKGFVLSVVYLSIKPCDLLSCLADVLLKSGIIALYCL